MLAISYILLKKEKCPSQNFPTIKPIRVPAAAAASGHHSFYSCTGSLPLLPSWELQPCTASLPLRHQFFPLYCITSITFSFYVLCVDINMLSPILKKVFSNSRFYSSSSLPHSSMSQKSWLHSLFTPHSLFNLFQTAFIPRV